MVPRPKLPVDKGPFVDADDARRNRNGWLHGYVIYEIEENGVKTTGPLEYGPYEVDARLIDPNELK